MGYIATYVHFFKDWSSIRTTSSVWLPNLHQSMSGSLFIIQPLVCLIRKFLTYHGNVILRYNYHWNTVISSQFVIWRIFFTFIHTYSRPGMYYRCGSVYPVLKIYYNTFEVFSSPPEVLFPIQLLIYSVDYVYTLFFSRPVVKIFSPPIFF